MHKPKQLNQLLLENAGVDHDYLAHDILPLVTGDIDILQEVVGDWSQSLFGPAEEPVDWRVAHHAREVTAPDP